MARRILRDRKDASGEERIYLKYARIAYMQMLKDILPSSDYVVDETKESEEKVDEIVKIIFAL